MATRDLIYDVGMNNGDDTAHYLDRGYRVVGIEADPHLAKSCAERFREELAAGRLVILNCAVGPTPGLAKFWLCVDKPEWNSFRKSSAGRLGHPVEEINVEVRTFGAILAEHGVPHYLKIDIEGHDIHCLEALDPRDLPDLVSLEMEGLDGLLTLRELGYDGFKLVLQERHRELVDETRTLSGWFKQHLERRAWTSRLSAKAGRLRRRFVRHATHAADRFLFHRTPARSFPHGSSGPFGNDAPGQWTGFEGTCLKWLDHSRTYRGDIWCDVHATRLSTIATASVMRAA